jgi:hypothetical protein
MELRAEGFCRSAWVVGTSTAVQAPKSSLRCTRFGIFSSICVMNSQEYLILLLI